MKGRREYILNKMYKNFVVYDPTDKRIYNDPRRVLVHVITKDAFNELFMQALAMRDALQRADKELDDIYTHECGACHNSLDVKITASNLLCEALTRFTKYLEEGEG